MQGEMEEADWRAECDAQAEAEGQAQYEYEAEQEAKHQAQCQADAEAQGEAEAGMAAEAENEKQDCVLEHNHNIFQKFVEEMVKTDTIATSTGIFEVGGKKYILNAEVKEVKQKQ